MPTTPDPTPAPSATRRGDLARRVAGAPDGTASGPLSTVATIELPAKSYPQAISVDADTGTLYALGMYSALFVIDTSTSMRQKADMRVPAPEVHPRKDL